MREQAVFVRKKHPHNSLHFDVESRRLILLDLRASHASSLEHSDQQPPIRSANPSLASNPLASSISSKLCFPQKAFTPLTNRLLISSTSGSFTAAKQILMYAQLRLSLISSVGAKREPGVTNTRYFFVVRWTHSPCASFGAEILFQRGWEGKLRWTLTWIRLKTLPCTKGKEDSPYEHASNRPGKIVDGYFVNGVPLIINALATTRLD